METWHYDAVNISLNVGSYEYEFELLSGSRIETVNGC
jgi:hypothetical protein